MKIVFVAIFVFFSGAVWADDLLVDPSFSEHLRAYTASPPDEDPALHIVPFREAVSRASELSRSDLYPLVISRIGHLHRAALLKFKSAEAHLANRHLEFFNFLEEFLPAVRYAYGAKLMGSMHAAATKGDVAQVRADIALFAQVGVADFQGEIITRLNSRAYAPYKHELIAALGRTGNQIAANYIYERLLRKPSVVYLDALCDAGLPSFGPIYENRNVLNQARNALRGFKEGLHAAQIVEVFKKDFAEFTARINKVLVALPLEDAQRAAYRARLLQGRGEKEPPGGYRIRHHGMEFREGDLVLGLNTIAPNRMWSALTSYPTHFGHGGIVIFLDGYPFLLEMNSRLMFSPLERRLNRLTSYLAFRHEGMAEPRLLQRVREEVAFYRKHAKEVVYDLKFDYRSEMEIYCIEIIYHIFRKAGLPGDWTFARAETKQAQANLERLALGNMGFLTDGMLFRMPQLHYLGNYYPAAQGNRMEGYYILSALLKRFHTQSLTPERVRNEWLFSLGAKLGAFADFLGMRTAPRATVQGYLAVSGTLLLAQSKLTKQIKEEKLSLADFPRYRARVGALTEVLTKELYDTLFSSGD